MKVKRGSTAMALHFMSRTYRKGTWSDFSSPKKFTRDQKKFHKPPKYFKNMQKNKRKAQEKQALRQDKEIPKFPKTDVWDYS